MIIFSPTKTMKVKAVAPKEKDFIFPDKVKELVRQISCLSEDEMASFFKIKGQVLTDTYNYYQTFDQVHQHTIDIYSGISFRQISNRDTAYLTDNVFILSALYGLNDAMQPISPYRLDFTSSKIFEQSLYKFWEQEVLEFVKFKNRDILDLASKEYSKMINPKLLDCNFYQVEFVATRKLSTVDLKKLRGHVLDYCILNAIYDYKELLKMETKWVNSVTLKENVFTFSVDKDEIDNK